MRLLVVVVVVLALGGCSRAPEPVAVPDPSASAPERAEVQWADYPSDLQQIVDEEQAAANCEALQDMFDVQANSSDAMAERSDHNNASIMQYIYEAQELAGC